MARGMLAPITRTRRTRRINRIGIAIIGFVLLVAGAAGAIASRGVLGGSVADREVFDPATRRFVTHTDWFWYVAAVVAILVALVGLWWLVIQLRIAVFGDISVESDSRRGETVLDSGAVTDAVCAQVAAVHGVENASASLLGDPAEPMLLLDVWLDGREDLPAVRAKVEGGALADLEHAMDWTDVPTRVEYRLQHRAVRAVR